MYAIAILYNDSQAQGPPPLRVRAWSAHTSV